jgi:hypothetical protein
MLRSIRARFAAVVLSAMVALLVLPGAAFATTHTAAIETEITGALDDVKGVVLAVVGALFGLVLIGVAVRVGVKYAKRGASAG